MKEEPEVEPAELPVPAPGELLPDWPAELDPFRSAMLDRFGLPMRLLSRLFFSRMSHSPGIQSVRDAARQGTVVYVMRTHSTLDWLYFNWLAQQNGLPLAEYANGVDNALVAPLADVIRSAWARWRWSARHDKPFPDAVDDGYLSRLVASGQSALVFLRRGRGLTAPHGDCDLVEVLVEAQQQTDTPIFLVPQILVWERSPDRTNRGLVDVLMGEPDRPGAFRKLLFVLLNHRNAVARVGEPVNLKQFLADQQGQPVARVAKKLRWLLLGYLYRERKVVKGPDVRPRRWIFDRILAEPAVQAEIERTASRQGKSVRTVRKKARQVLDRAGADFSWGMIQAFRTVIDVICSRIYAGVEFDAEDSDRIRQAARNGTVVLVPSHRSHFDYLLLSWLLYHQGMMPPHIAAGENLAFFPMGPLFRRAGAFFIRRSFQGDDLYAELMAQYVRALVAEGYTQEFFIEGGRSRTGKMLQPKVGLLATYVDAAADRIAPDIQIVPIYIAYERIVEDYSKELSGGEKKKETAGGLIGQAGVLRKRFGRVYVKTNNPISLRESVDSAPGKWQDLSFEERKAHLKNLAGTIAHSVQDVTVVTPSTVAATVLLAHDRRGITRQSFLRRARLFRRWLERRRAWFSDAWHFPEDALNESLELFAESKWVEVLDHLPGEESDDDVIAITQDARRRMQLDYYKNNVMFHLVPAAFFLTALEIGGRQEESLKRIRRRVGFLRDLFAGEFLEDPANPDPVDSVGRDLQAEGVIEVTGPADDDAATLVRGADPSLTGAEFRLGEDTAPDQDVNVRLLRPDLAHLMMSTVRNFYEAYYVVLEGSVVLRSGALTENQLVSALLQSGKRMFLTEDVTRPEAISKVNLTNAVRHFARKGVFTVYDGTGRDARLQLVEEQRDRYMTPMEQLFHSGRRVPSSAP